MTMTWIRCPSMLTRATVRWSTSTDVLTMLAILARVDGCHSSSYNPDKEAQTLNLNSGTSSKLKSSGIEHSMRGEPKMVRFPSVLADSISSAVSNRKTIHPLGWKAIRVSHNHGFLSLSTASLPENFLAMKPSRQKPHPSVIGT